MNISHNKFPMKVIYSLLFTVLLSLSFSFSVFAQPDYLKKAESFISSGDYANAEKQLVAQRAYLDSKKVDKNSNSYIDVEKKLRRVVQCKPLMEAALRVLSNGLSEEITNSLDNAKDTSDAAKIAEGYTKRLNSVRKNLREVSSTFPSDRKAKSKLAEVESLISQIKDETADFEENSYWKYAKKQNVKEAYEDFISKYPKGKRAVLARAAISRLEEDAVWAQCLNDGTSTAFRKYLAQFPKGIHKSEADSLCRLRVEEETWAEADTKEGLMAYIKSFPSGRHLREAESRLSEITEYEAWSQAASDGTEKSLRNYLSMYPSGRYADNAHKGLLRLEEKDVWEKALDADTFEAYRNYLSTSKSGAYAEEAKAAIARLEKEQALKADEASWNSIKSSTDPNDFKRYLSTSSYRDPSHERVASYKYNVLNAAKCYRNKLYSDAVSYYEKAESVMPLSGEDRMMLLDCKQEALYSKFLSNPSVDKGNEYISAYPQGKYANEVFHKICLSLADGMSYSTTYGEYQRILLYAKTDEDRDYVNRCYRAIQNDAKKVNRRLDRKSELFHLLLGVEGFYLFDIVEVPANEDIGQEASWTLASADCFGVAPIISFGGRSNRLNLEAGYDFINNQVIARPRLNLLKKSYSGSKLGHRRGSDYSLCALYVAPEAFIDVRNTDNIRYGIRGGFSLHWFDIFGGYKFNDNRLYFGLGVYFGNK